MKTLLVGFLLVALCGCNRWDEKAATAAASVVEVHVGAGAGVKVGSSQTADKDLEDAVRNVRTVVSPSWQGAAGKK